jgi:hypothetical protein
MRRVRVVARSRWERDAKTLTVVPDRRGDVPGPSEAAERPSGERAGYLATAEGGRTRPSRSAASGSSSRWRGPSLAGVELVLRRVVQWVEVGDDTLLFVPTVGEPVEWEPQNMPRGMAIRRSRRILA